MPVNFQYEKMAHEYAAQYSLNPEWVKDNINVYDYYEMLLVNIQKSLAQEHILEQKRKKSASGGQPPAK
jgi:hypothetical protein